MSSTDAIKWDSICTFAEDVGAGVPPMLYQDAHVPTCDDLRGGRFEVAELSIDAPAVPGEMPGLLIAVTDKDAAAAVVLDGFQVAILINSLRGWLDREVPTP